MKIIFPHEFEKNTFSYKKIFKLYLILYLKNFFFCCISAYAGYVLFLVW